MCFFDNSKGHEEQRREEQRKYGVFFDDDYDYLQHLKEASGPSELVPSVRGQQSRIVVTSEGHIEDEIQRVPVSSTFVNNNLMLFFRIKDPVHTLTVFNRCYCNYDLPVYIFIYRIVLTPSQTSPQVKPRVDKPKFIGEQYFASTVLKGFLYP